MIEKLSTYDVDRKHLCYAGNSNDEQFPAEISKYVDANDIEELRTLVEQIEQNKDTTMISETAKCKEYLSEHSRTAKLWIQYIHYINIVKRFIRAKPTGNWQNHLMVIRQMINLFSATAHVQYAKSARLYLQRMDELPPSRQLIFQGSIICFSRVIIQLEHLNDFGQDFGQT